MEFISRRQKGVCKQNVQPLGEMFLYKIERNLLRILLHDSDIILRKNEKKLYWLVLALNLSFEVFVTLLKTTKKLQQKLRRYATGIDN